MNEFSSKITSIKGNVKDSLPSKRIFFANLIAITSFFTIEAFSNANVKAAEVLPQEGFYFTNYFPFFVAIFSMVIAALLLPLRKHFDLTINLEKALFMTTPFLVLAPCAFAYSLYVYVTPALIVLSSVIYALGSVITFIFLISNLSKLNLTTVVVILTCMGLLRSVIFQIVEYMPTIPYLVFMGALPIIQIAALIAGKGTATATAQQKEHKDSTPYILLITTGIIGFALSSEIQMPYQACVYMSATNILSLTLVLSSLVGGYILLTRRINFNIMLYCVVLPLIAFGLILIRFNPTGINEISQFVLITARTLSYSAYILLFCYLVKYSSFNYYWLALIGSIGLSIGRASIIFLTETLTQIADDETVFTYLIPYVSFGIMFACIIFYHRNNMKNSWGKTTSTSDIYTSDKTVKCANIIASRCELTDRETDILILLAKGKTTPAIATSLFISENTVKMHRKKIYRKMEIHKKQELMDMFEETQKSL